MNTVRQLLAGFRLIVQGHSRRVLLLWGLAVVLLALTPFALADPAMWVFVFDPELAAVLVLVGLAGMRVGAARVLGHPLLAVVRFKRR